MKKGYLLKTDEAGRKVEGDTLSCKHCQKMWVVQKGRGRERGWCMNCYGPTCGSKECRECVPFMRKMEKMIQKDILFRSLGLGHK